MKDRETRHILSFALRELRAMSWRMTFKAETLRSDSINGVIYGHFQGTRLQKGIVSNVLGSASFVVPSNGQITKKTLVFRCSLGLLFIFGTGVMLGRRRLSSAKTESSCLAAASFVAIAQAAPSAKPPFLTYNHERRWKVMENDGKWWQMMENDGTMGIWKPEKCSRKTEQQV